MLSKKKLPLLLTLLFLLLVLFLTVWAVGNQRLEIREKAAEPTTEEKEIFEIRPLNISKPIYSFSVSGNLSLNQETSFLRIILIDENQKEYLVYEAYPLITGNQPFSFTDVCEETCLLEAIIPDKLRIEGLTADFEITQTSYEDKFQRLPAKVQSLGIERSQVELKKERESQKIAILNDQIKVKGLKWIAGETSVSKLSYSEKKKLFAKSDGTPADTLPNLQGFEYYKGGIFEIAGGGDLTTPTPGTPTPSTEPSLLPVSWDWRNVHGENWNTSVKDQGPAGTCWAHSTIGAMESLINLYFNQHLNVDLSEQALVDCKFHYEKSTGPCFGNYRDECVCSIPYGEYSLAYWSDYCISAFDGFPEELCDPYVARDWPIGPVPKSLCTDHICIDWQNRVWKNSDYKAKYCAPEHTDFSRCRNILTLNDENDLKENLITLGPVNAEFRPWQHSMVLAGYETEFEDDQTIWIFKNSWGENFGELGYAKISAQFSDVGRDVEFPLGPFIPPLDHSFWPDGFDGTIECVDGDDDGYCNWGVSENKPDTCLASCQPEKDCDDSNPDLGPFDENLNCTQLNITPTPRIIRLHGSVSLQGRPNPPSRQHVIALKIEIDDNDYEIITDWNGKFDFPLHLAPAVYDIRVKGFHTLANIKRGVDLSSTTNEINFGTLIEGDANDDNRVSIIDFSILAKSYGSQTDPRVDFNGDGIVTIVDFSWLSTNFGKFGDIEIE